MKLVLLTGPGLPHKYIATRLSENFDLELVISENNAEDPEEIFPDGEAEMPFIKEHFRKRRQSELEFFEDYREFPEEVPLRELPEGEINSEEISELVENIAPDYIILFGSSILRSSLMDTYRSRIIHLHLGLFPYYSGWATNLFPFYHDEPECIGASLHLVSVEPEEGEILHQLRPEMEAEDDLHRIGNKVIWKAGIQLPGVLRGFASQNITPQPQMPAGRICLQEDLSPEVLQEIYRKFGQGMIEGYLRDKERRDAAQRIVDADLQLE